MPPPSSSTRRWEIDALRGLMLALMTLTHLPTRLTTPLGFVCTMGLTFENANLDLAAAYADAARAVGDGATAAILDEVVADEVDHVRFAATWLGKLAPGETMLAAYQRTVEFPLGLARARGVEVDRDPRCPDLYLPDLVDHLRLGERRRRLVGQVGAEVRLGKPGVENVAGVVHGGQAPGPGGAGRVGHAVKFSGPAQPGP